MDSVVHGPSVGKICGSVDELIIYCKIFYNNSKLRIKQVYAWTVMN